MKDSDPRVDEWLANAGYNEVRFEVIRWVPECDAEWDKVSCDGNYQGSFDWEFCPDFVLKKLEQFL
jgi:hypothetical protein